MGKTILLWGIALAVTLGAAVFQRVTGPTYPARGSITLVGSKIDYALSRSHGGNTDEHIAIAVPDSSIQGVLFFKRYGSTDEFQPIPMTLTGDSLTANLPHQPPAGKLEYYIQLIKGDSIVTVPQKQTVVIRFKGAVPKVVLIPHIIFIFLAMLWSTRTGLEALRPNGQTKRLTMQTTLLLLVGGMIMGPIVQKYAFGALWTGVPFGWDLTDNKTLIAFIGWCLALWRHRKQNFPRWWVIAAAIILIGIFSIPHSTMGSELNYDTGQVEVG